MASRMRWGSCALILLALASWTITLGGLSAVTWLSCADTAATRTSVAESEGGVTGAGILAALGVPAADGTDVAVCSRAWRWEWCVGAPLGCLGWMGGLPCEMREAAGGPGRGARPGPGLTMWCAACLRTTQVGAVP